MPASDGCGAESRRSAETRPRSHSWGCRSDPGGLAPAGWDCLEPACGSSVWRSGRGRGREGTSILERVRGARDTEGAGSLPRLPAPQSPSRDPCREERPGRVGGRWGGAGRRLPHRRLREAPLARSLARAAGWGGDSGRRSDRRTGGRKHRGAAPPPRPDPLRDPRGQEVGPRCSRCRRRLQPRCGAEAVSARRAGSVLSRASAPAGAARASSVGLLGCLSALRPPPAQSSGPASPGPGCSGRR